MIRSVRKKVPADDRDKSQYSTFFTPLISSMYDLYRRAPVLRSLKFSSWLPSSGSSCCGGKCTLKTIVVLLLEVPTDLQLTTVPQ